MEVIKNYRISCFDVDDTLVIWGRGQDPKAIAMNNWGFTERLVPHEGHIAQLKRHKFRGGFVIVWSQAGHDWALEVIKRLQLEPWVDLVMAKPTWYIDDLKADAWMKHLYEDFVSDDGDDEILPP